MVQIVNEDHTLEELILEFETNLMDYIGIDRLLVYHKTGKHWNPISAKGVPSKQVATIDVNKELSNVKRITRIDETNQTDSLQGFDAIIPLFHKFSVVGYVLVGKDHDNNPNVNPLSDDDNVYIQILSNLIVVFLESNRAQALRLSKTKEKNEFDVAAKIQTGLIPKDTELANSHYTKIKAVYHPYQAVGGDYYDVINLSKHTLGFCIADVSGHGISAALLMSNFQAMFRALFTDEIPLPVLIHELNKRVSRNASISDKFITFFVGRYSLLSGRLEYVNAGHLAPILFDTRTNSLRELQEGCIGLGMLDFIPTIEVGSIKIRKGSRLVAFTDGLVEVEKSDNTVSRSLDDVQDAIRSTTDIDDTMAELAKLAEIHQQRKMVFDDVSILGIQFLKNAIVPFI